MNYWKIIKMNKTALGNTEEMISCMGLGTMYFGTKVDEPISFNILDYYVARGGSLLDSANKYASWVPGFQGGESETLLGKWMKNRGIRQQMFITSKVGFPYGNVPRSLKKEIVISECEKSLKRLGVETIDLYFAHAYDANTPIEVTMEAFFQLKKQGKIRFAGASNFYGWQLSEANLVSCQQNWEGFCCLQQRHTYLEPGLRSDFGTQLLLTPEIQALCKTKNISLMAYSPLLGGAYVRNDRPIPVHYQSKANEFRLVKLNETAEELQVSPNAVVLAWMMQCYPQIIPMVTGSSVIQLEENFKALSFTLTKEQIGKLNQAIDQPNKYA
jgi:aryl-alcohol dehydrogenase-like predicted oxidoreductase